MTVGMLAFGDCCVRLSFGRLCTSLTEEELAGVGVEVELLDLAAYRTNCETTLIGCSLLGYCGMPWKATPCTDGLSDGQRQEWRSANAQSLCEEDALQDGYLP
jgi:hypothetical protein